MQGVLFLDYDDTLHDTLSKFIGNLDGLLGLSGEELWHLYIDEIHRGIIHSLHPERHDDIPFQLAILFEKLGQPYNPQITERFINGYRAAERATWATPTFFPDTIPFLDEVKGRGYRLVLVTGKWAEEKAKALHKAGGRKYFDHVFGEAYLGYLKTNPHYYQEALKRSNSLAPQTVMIGDSPTNDIAPAKVWGMKAIWVNRRAQPFEGTDVNPDFTVRNLPEALSHL
jgi:FMN phosphatase YigB (HAD superfamily)